MVNDAMIKKRTQLKKTKILKTTQNVPPQKQRKMI